MDTRRLQYLDAMDIQTWVRRDSSAPGRDEVSDTSPEENIPSPLVPRSSSQGDAKDDIASLDWEALQQRVKNCTLCAELTASRTQTVFGVGDRQAQWLVIGEAPGAEEDAQGEPFVGRAGQLLNAMLHAIGLQRGQVYIANVLKCRPPGNRDPRPDEAANCEPYLQRQIALIEPRLILVVGRIAAQHLLKTDTPIGKLRGQVHRYGDIPLVVTYHPAYLLRSPGEKRKAWADLRLALTVMQQQRAS
ncbi:uracil-DNA glycosylase [Sulfurivermis fontis]|jgi:DNA polymerase|uniref:uracil-DNA glycosylase n=1 Tax=Sulfurivermis fontis TaxID=1972068 RepID=UPI000FDBF8AA|nr:uracil-DNA glycosylase [Sulfurivermis fontis]